MLFRTKFAALAVTTFLSVFSWQAAAQAIPTASKRGDLDAFFTYGKGKTDYGPEKNNIFAFGADYMFKPLRFGQPGVNVRYSHSSGPVVDEPFYGGGLDLRFRERYHLRPYAVADVGIGGVTFKPARALDDTGFAYLFGGGTDIPITPKIAARVEFDYQHITISGGSGPNLTFTPYSLNVGVVYRIR